MRVTVSVAFANGRHAEFTDKAYWQTLLLGASDMNSDGRAEIVFIDSELAHSFAVEIVRWDGSKLAAVTGTDGKRLPLEVGGYASAASGFRCSGSSFVTSFAYFNGLSGSAGVWSGTQTTYGWRGDMLTKAAQVAISFRGGAADGTSGERPAEYDKINGAHCPGLSQTLPKF